MGRTALRVTVLAAGLLGVAWGCPVARAAGTLERGSPAPDFRLPGVDGKTYSLESFGEAQVLVIIFTCNHCPTAQAYEDRIKQLAADYKDRKVAVVAISPNDPEAVRLDELGYSDLGDSLEDMRIRAKDKAFNFPYLYDGQDQKVSRAYGPAATPHVFVFDRARKLRYAGRIDNSEKPDRVTSQETRDAIEALLAGKAVPVEATKAFGCSTKWSDKRAAARQSLENWAKEEVGLKPIDPAGVQALVRNEGAKLRLITVWATDCSASVDALPGFVTTNRMYRRRGFEWVTVSADSAAGKNKALEVLKAKQAAATNYLFDGKDLPQLLDAAAEKASAPLPHTILVAPGGKVLYRKSGPCEPLEVRKAIVGYLGRTYK
ncbi:MAG: redoxin domain-containing protein [Planctomycetes bacterium]|nr:redoxin domain-containing protein [Planctomycetota bacterium]